MKTYSSFGASSNADVAHDAERAMERWARRISLNIGLSFPLALAWVRANMPIKEASND
ncbi:hypothetical protein [Bradyrhizobium sp. Mp27]|uniref:hypothetical protein n=1 Tax=Bradyrhizobium sp. Mp27 TaxID=3042157 RepID=UPI00248BE51B|nr:hypothetical protein [Bradyrhizobium sp. Mp27]MDI2073041.1 hypothetical protein [Bradyrhizobium sp. Mp27]